MTEEQKPKQDLGRILTDEYLKAGKDSTAIKNMPCIDEARQLEWVAQLDRLKKERDPADYYNQLGRFWANAKQTLGIFVGKDKYGGKFDDLDPEEQLGTYAQLGTGIINKYINPDKV